MNLYISCFTSDFEIMRIKWSLKKTGGVLSDAQQVRFDTQTGSILSYSWDDDEIVSETIQGCPFGMYTHDGMLYVCDAKYNTVVVYDAVTLEPINTIQSKLFNDIHSITGYGDYLLIASTGIDSVLKLSLDDHTIRPVVSFAIDENSALGLKAGNDLLDTERDYSKEHINTESQLTHLNYAAPLSDGRIGISLFHQGKIITYDESRGSIETIIQDLVRSHSFFEFQDKIFVADSGNYCVKIYEKNTYKLIQTIEHSGWVQDIKHITLDHDDLMTVCNADNAIIYIYDLNTLDLVRSIQLDTKYRLSSCELRLA